MWKLGEITVFFSEKEFDFNAMNFQLISRSCYREELKVENRKKTLPKYIY